MRMIIKRIISIAALVAMLSGCNDIGNPEGDLKDIKLEDWPLTDCSTSTMPARDLVAYKLLGVPYKWEEDWMGSPTYIIQPDFSGTKTSFSYRDYLDKNLCSGTHGAYMNLIEGKTDVIIASRDISRNETASAAELGVELKTAPLAIDALVFIVNPKNPVKNLTADQVRKIYTGEITNWKEVGGNDATINPYIRNANSGSQEKMETIVMNGLKMIDWPEMVGYVMLSPYYQLEQDENGIAYTPFYYYDTIVNDDRTQVIGVNGIVPSKQTIEDDSYPYVTHVMASVRANTDKSSTTYQLFYQLATGQHNDIVKESGYIVD